MLKEIIKNPMYRFLLILTLTTYSGFQAWITIYNNYAVQVVGVNGFQAGVIQSVREIPGFLSLLVIFLLLIFKEHRLAVFSTLLLGIGIFATGMFTSFGGLMLTTVIMSIGFHYYETVNQSLILQHFNRSESVTVIARLKSLSSVFNVIVGIIIWFSSKYLNLSWHFYVSGAVVIIIAVYMLFKEPKTKPTVPQHKKMILRKEYWLFYVLNFLGGARRQIFMVFAIYMLVQKYGYSIEKVTVLFVINNALNYFLAPVFGKGINRFGERVMLSMEYFCLIFVFIGYAMVENALFAAFLYVIDQAFFGAQIATNTYFQKTARSSDIAPSMAAGFTINHISAVIIPIIGGALWMLNWRIPFIAGAIFALLALVFSQLVKIPE
jgi:hypothetical protein